MLLLNLEHLSLLTELGAGIGLISRFLGDDPLGRLRDLPDGRHDVAPGVWVNLERPLGRDSGLYESHRHYADLQISLTDRESVACLPVECLQLKEDYDSERDILFWSGSVFSPLPLVLGTGLLLFPADGHMPCLGQGRLHKAVFKIHRDLFSPDARSILFK